jgi:hypothetical protein
MLPNPGLSPFSIDLTRLCHRSVTSFYSNLVTRPTGRAVRMGVESQLAELGTEREPCLSILDFSQVRVVDYSCADEIVAKLLLRYVEPGRPADVFFLIRGLQEHQEDAVEAVLERHDLLVVVERSERAYHLLGPSDPFQRSCWTALQHRREAALGELAADTQLPEPVVAASLVSLVGKRVALRLQDGRAIGVPRLLGP